MKSNLFKSKDVTFCSNKICKNYYHCARSILFYPPSWKDEYLSYNIHNIEEPCDLYIPSANTEKEQIELLAMTWLLISDSIRKGQALMTAIKYINPELYNNLMDYGIDCFYNDSLVKDVKVEIDNFYK